jgi:hypothetical protein
VPFFLTVTQAAQPMRPRPSIFLGQHVFWYIFYCTAYDRFALPSSVPHPNRKLPPFPSPPPPRWPIGRRAAERTNGNGYQLRDLR